MSFTKAQTDQLLKPIHPSRIVRAQGHAHVSQQDVLAHLIRIFGFGNFDIDVLEIAHVFTSDYADSKAVLTGGYNVCYRALVKVTIRDLEGNEMCHYVNGSTATARNQNLGDGHDLAYKSALSLSVKRACIALGDQFGLSLYNRGQEEALVMASLAYLPKDQSADVQDGVAEQVSLGHDEIEKDIEAESVVLEVEEKQAPIITTGMSDSELSVLRFILDEISAADEMKQLIAIGNRHFPLIDIQFLTKAEELTTLRAALDSHKRSVLGQL